VLTVAGAPKMAAGLAAGRVGKTTVAVRSTPLVDFQPAVSLASLAAPATAGGAAPLYTATLAGPQGAACRAGPKPMRYTWTLTRTAPGGKAAPMTDLETYLGAPMHLLVASSDLSFAGHVHGMAAPPAAAAATATSAKQAAAPAAAPAAGAGGMDMSGMGSMGGMDHSSHGRRRMHLRMRLRMLLQATMGGMSMPRTAAPKGAAAAPAPAEDHSAHSDEDHAKMAQPPAGAKFGPGLVADVVMPAKGTYALVAQMRRGKELILVPFYVDCSGPVQQ
jgi:hypothetical protein